MAKKEERALGAADGRSDRRLQRPNDNRTEEAAIRSASILELSNVPLSELQVRWTSRFPQFLAGISALRRDRYKAVSGVPFVVKEYIALLSIATKILTTAETTKVRLTEFTVDGLRRLIVSVDMEYFRCEREGLPFFTAYASTDQQQSLLALEGHLRDQLSIPPREKNRTQFVEKMIVDLEILLGTFKQAVFSYLSAEDRAHPVGLPQLVEQQLEINSMIDLLLQNSHAVIFRQRIQTAQAKYQTYQSLLSLDEVAIHNAPSEKEVTRALLYTLLRSAAQSLSKFFHENEYWINYRVNDPRLTPLFRSTLSIYKVLQAFYVLDPNGTYDKRITSSIKSIQNMLRKVPSGIEKRYQPATQENIQEFSAALEYIKNAPHTKNPRRD